MSERIRIEDEVVVATIRAAISAERRRPRYEVLIDTIAQLIRDGQLEPGASLPTEPQLAIDLGISRTTIRHAFDELAQRGIIVRRRGVGTFVTSPAVEQPLGQMSSFVKTLASQRDDSDSRLLGVRLT
ncbi:MAG: GntR family transcriptional regulator, partial [Thermomicrobiales bacterium]